MKSVSNLQLQVLICTIGEEGINRVASHSYPKLDGVEYIVSWQIPDEAEIETPPVLRHREDFKIYCWKDKGISVNRNHALQVADAQIVLMTDDDIIYTSGQIRALMELWENNPELDVITTRYDSDCNHKDYPAMSFNLCHPPKGYSVTCFEISFRPASIKAKGIKFNEFFGFSTLFHGGEEVVFIHDIVKAGLSGKFFPITVGFHPGLTTGGRDKAKPEFIQTKGAIISYMHPLTWPLRMLAHAQREGTRTIGRLNYIVNWLKGVKTARKAGVFKN